MSQNVTSLIEETKKKVNGVMSFIKTWATNSSVKPHNTIGTVLYQVLGQVLTEISRIPPSIVNSQAETVLAYNLLDLNIIIARTDDLVRKSKEASSHFFSKMNKYLEKIAFMCKLLYGIFYLVSCLFRTPPYPLSVPYVMGNKEAETFWLKNFGNNTWYAEYNKFTLAIKPMDKKAAAVLESNSDTSKNLPQVVTAIRFSFMVDCTFKSFLTGLTKENPFLIPSSVKPNSIGPAQPASDPSSTSIETGKTSEYFYIVSACVGDDTNVCVQVSGKYNLYIYIYIIFYIFYYFNVYLIFIIILL